MSGINWTEILITIGGVLTALILAGLRQLAKALTNWVGQKVSNEKVKGALILGTDAVVQAVAEVQQVVVNELKAAAADGKLTSEEITKVKNLALEQAKRNLGANGMKLIQAALGFSVAQVEQWLSGRIEAVIAENKNP